MAQAIDWHGTNKTLLPPPGEGEDRCSKLPIFNNGNCSVSCWELSDEELAEIVRTKQVFLSVWYGPTSPPVLVGSESIVRSVVVDYGGAWKRKD